MTLQMRFAAIYAALLTAAAGFLFQKVSRNKAFGEGKAHMSVAD